MSPATSTSFAGFPPDHPRADLLRRRGLYASSPRIPAERVGAASLVEAVFAHFAAMAPLYRWLTNLSTARLDERTEE